MLSEMKFSRICISNITQFTWLSFRRNRQPRKPNEKDCLAMTHSNMLEATTCKGSVRHQCAARNADNDGSVLKQSQPQDNEYAYVWDTPHHRTTYYGNTDIATKIVPVCVERQDIDAANIHISANIKNSGNEYNMICDTLPKENAMSWDNSQTNSSFKPSQHLTFHRAGVHFDPDVVPLPTNPAAKS